MLNQSMFWMLLIYNLFTAQGGIYRDQLFALEAQRKPPIVQSADLDAPVSRRQANVTRKSGY